jgi:hypothetical protein
MRGEQVQGRFNISHERGSIIGGTTREVVRTVGYVVEWWFYSPVQSQIDDIYDVGSPLGGRHWNGPHYLPVVNAVLKQGATVQSAQGFYNTDVLTLDVNMDVIDGSSLSGGESSTLPELRYLPSNPDSYLRDRIIFKNEVFTPKRIVGKGIITNDYTLFQIECYQVNAEEMVNDPQFQEYANYSAFGLRSQYSFDADQDNANDPNAI